MQFNINLFISSVDDMEMSQYLLLASLKSHLDQLHRNKLYPSFHELMEFASQLNRLLQEKENIEENLPKKMVGFDFEEKKLKYEKARITEDDAKKVFEFIEWALPKIKDAVEEGKAIFDFVDSNITIREVGILPIYREEGYFIVPDHYQKKINIYRYKLSSIVTSDIPFRALKTNLVESRDDCSLVNAPEHIKLDLIRHYSDLPNPAAYNIHTELDLPFDETILPIAKRKLMRALAA